LRGGGGSKLLSSVSSLESLVLMIAGVAVRIWPPSPLENRTPREAGTGGGGCVGNLFARLSKTNSGLFSVFSAEPTVTHGDTGGGNLVEVDFSATAETFLGSFLTTSGDVFFTGRKNDAGSSVCLSSFRKMMTSLSVSVSFSSMSGENVFALRSFGLSFEGQRTLDGEGKSESRVMGLMTPTL
jgi:hypothetical protein